MKEVRYKVESGLAWLILDNPPLNALSHALRRAIVDGLDRAVADPKVQAIVIIGSERAFSSGADIKEFSGGAFYAEPFLPAVCDVVEAAGKPVIAGIGGAGRGGGHVCDGADRGRVHGRRPRARALLPLPRGARRREDRVSRSEARPDPGG